MNKLDECSILIPTQYTWGRQLANRVASYRGQHARESDGASSVMRIIGRTRVKIRREDFDAAGAPAHYWAVLSKTRSGYLRQNTDDVIEIVTDPQDVDADADPLAALPNGQPSLDIAYLQQKANLRDGTFHVGPAQPAPGTARAMEQLRVLADEVDDMAAAAQARRLEEHRAAFVEMDQSRRLP